MGYRKAGQNRILSGLFPWKKGKRAENGAGISIFS